MKRVTNLKSNPEPKLVFEPVFVAFQSVEGFAERIHEVDEGGRPHEVDELTERLSKSWGSRNRNSGPEEDHKGRSHQDREQKISSRNEPSSLKCSSRKRHS